MSKRIFMSNIGIKYPENYSKQGSENIKFEQDKIANDKKFIDIINKNLAVYDENAIIGKFTKELIPQILKKDLISENNIYEQEKFLFDEGN